MSNKDLATKIQEVLDSQPAARLTPEAITELLGAELVSVDMPNKIMTIRVQLPGITIQVPTPIKI